MKVYLIRRHVVHAFDNVNFAGIWPVSLQGLPDSRPSPASFWHVVHVEHGDMGGIFVVGANTDRISTGTSWREHGGIVCTQNETVGSSDRQTEPSGSCTVDIVDSAISGIWDSLEVERVVKVFADDYIGEGITTTRNSEFGLCGPENRLHAERESRGDAGTRKATGLVSLAWLYSCIYLPVYVWRLSSSSTVYIRLRWPDLSYPPLQAK